MKNLIKKWFGLDKIEAAVAEAEDKLKATTEKIVEAKMSPKELATAKGEPWVAVLDTHINKENVRNGFFELDWNDLFVVQLKQAGYGFEGDPDEEIVDRWFRDLAANMLAESGQDPNRSSAGFINVSRLGGGKAIVE
jgi:hypothetical protein